MTQINVFYPMDPVKILLKDFQKMTEIEKSNLNPENEIVFPETFKLKFMAKTIIFNLKEHFPIPFPKIKVKHFDKSTMMLKVCSY